VCDEAGAAGHEDGGHARLHFAIMQVSSLAKESGSAMTRLWMNEPLPTTVCESAGSVSVRRDPLKPAQAVTTM